MLIISGQEYDIEDLPRLEIAFPLWMLIYSTGEYDDYRIKFICYQEKESFNEIDLQHKTLISCLRVTENKVPKPKKVITRYFLD